ncbi:MAG: hypothetical protein WA188_05255 [Terriglobales bacterium]
MANILFPMKLLFRVCVAATISSLLSFIVAGSTTQSLQASLRDGSLRCIVTFHVPFSHREILLPENALGLEATAWIGMTALAVVLWSLFLLLRRRRMRLSRAG